MLFNVSSAVTVIANFCTRVAWVCLVCLVCLLFCKVEGSSPVPSQLLRRGIWACMRCPYLYLCWVGGYIYIYISQLPYVWYYVVVVKSSFKNARESKRACVFMCLMFSLSGPCS